MDVEKNNNKNKKSNNIISFIRHDHRLTVCYPNDDFSYPLKMFILFYFFHFDRAIRDLVNSPYAF